MYCQDRQCFRTTKADVNRLAQDEDIAATAKFRTRLIKALEDLECDHYEIGFGHIDFFDLLRKMCPGAQPKHLRMFESWCNSYDELVRRRADFVGLEEAAATFGEVSTKPIIPESEMESLEREFHKLDK